jgi:hypothetical protein
MRRVLWLVLVLFLGSCLGLGCGRGKDTPPTKPRPVPSKSDLGKLPKREPQRR